LGYHSCAMGICISRYSCSVQQGSIKSAQEVFVQVIKKAPKGAF